MRRLLSLLPPLLLGLGALALLLGWNQLPQQWPVHWGLDGQPNGWATRTIASAFLPLGLGLAFWLFFEAIAWFTEQQRPQQLSPEDGARVARATGNLVRLTASITAAIMAFLAAALPFHPELGNSKDLPFILMGGIFTVIGLGLVAYCRELAQLKLPPAYKGLVYNDPHDKRLFVPKLIGVGWTINFGHPHAGPAVLVFLALIAVPMALVFMAR